MAYIGSSPIEKGTGLFSQDTFTGDGSTTTFDLTNVAPDGGGNELQVFVDNVRQQEGSSNAYTLGQDGSGDLKRITFTAAPAASASIFVLNPGTKNVLQVTTVSDNVVTTAKVQNNAVTVAKLASTLDLSSNTVTLPNNVVNADKIVDDAVSEEHLDVTAITGHTELSAVASSDDVLLVFDTSSSSLKKIQVSNINSAPTITSISPTNATSGDGTGNYTFTITGTNFNSGVTAFFLNNSGTEIAFSTVTRNSATQITAVIAKSSLLTSGEPFDIVVLNSNGQQAKLRNQVNVDNSPTFITAAGSLGTFNESSSVSASVNATDPDSAGNVTFELQSGSLPAGLSLTNTAAEGGTAIISGTASNLAATTTSNFVLRAVDAASNTSSRSFSITITHIPTSTSFTSSGTFAVPSGTSTADVLVVGGAGSGGGDNGGGGGAGGLIFFPGYPLTPGGTVTVTVGCGGGAAAYDGNQGSDSAFGSPGDPGLGSGGVLTAKGGGHGYVDPGSSGSPGGSGGGANGHYPGGSTPDGGGLATQPTQPGNSGAYGFGNNGGGSSPGTGSPARRAGGGGGAGAAGSKGCNYAGQGGDGKAYTIADGTTSVYYAAGGGGGSCAGNTSAQGGNGGGGGGGSPSGASGSGTDAGASGTANRGSGGGGGGNGANPGGAGGKGVVIVRY